MNPRHSKRCDFSTGFTPGCPYDGPNHVEGSRPHRPPTLRDVIEHAAILFAGGFIAWAIMGFPGVGVAS